MNIQNMVLAAAGFNRAYFDRGAIRSVSLYLFSPNGITVGVPQLYTKQPYI